MTFLRFVAAQTPIVWVLLSTCEIGICRAIVWTL